MTPTNWTLKLNANGSYDSRKDNPFDVTKCSLEFQSDKQVSVELANFVRVNILESVLSDFYEFDVSEVIAAHIEITQAIKHK